MSLPAERAGDSRPASAIGREARLDLTFDIRGGRTALTDGYAEPPLRIGRVHAADDAAYLILVCAGPGVFGGDSLRQRVTVRPGAHVVLTSQSALQVHPGMTARLTPGTTGRGAADVASIVHEYHLGDDAELQCHWDPVIPFADSALSQRFDIHLSPRSRLLWSDALMAGRVCRGEAWRFFEVAHELRIFVGGRLTYLERFRVRPDERRVDRRWITAGAPYVGTTAVFDRAVSDAVAETCHRLVEASPRVHGAVDVAAPSLLVARLLGDDGAAFAAARANLGRAAAALIFQRPDAACRK